MPADVCLTVAVNTRRGNTMRTAFAPLRSRRCVHVERVVFHSHERAREFADRAIEIRRRTAFYCIAKKRYSRHDEAVEEPAYRSS